MYTYIAGAEKNNLQPPLATIYEKLLVTNQIRCNFGSRIP